MLLYIKGAFDMVDLEAIFHCMLTKIVPQNTSEFSDPSVLKPQKELTFADKWTDASNNVMDFTNAVHSLSSFLPLYLDQNERKCE